MKGPKWNVNSRLLSFFFSILHVKVLRIMAMSTIRMDVLSPTLLHFCCLISFKWTNEYAVGWWDWLSWDLVGRIRSKCTLVPGIYSQVRCHAKATGYAVLFHLSCFRWHHTANRTSPAATAMNAACAYVNRQPHLSPACSALSRWRRVDVQVGMGWKNTQSFFNLEQA